MIAIDINPDGECGAADAGSPVFAGESRGPQPFGADAGCQRLP
ncbi:MAG: hypothetical protein Q4C54_10795 [Clostridia bacterium]|nr:hypothetical protein [Clostridia bacterium]